MAIFEIRMSDDQKEGTEASLGAWFKKPGEAVAPHEPVVEINTDKVTLEIAAPAGGYIREWLKQPGDTVLPGELLGTIDTANDSAASATATDSGTTLRAEVANQSAPPVSLGARESKTYSPAVRKLLSELGLDAGDIPKTARGGRLTPEDIGAFLKKEAAPAIKAEDESSTSSGAGRKVAHTPMRRSIASHMLQSMQTAPHVTSVFEADLYNVLAGRQSRKAKGDDAVPSVTAYLIRAALEAIKLVPEVNSKWHDTHLEIFDHVNFGVGTALDRGGLVVPVIQNAHTMDLLTLSENLRQ